jgi:hypothetical protein
MEERENNYTLQARLVEEAMKALGEKEAHKGAEIRGWILTYPLPGCFGSSRTGDGRATRLGPSKSERPRTIRRSVAASSACGPIVSVILNVWQPADADARLPPDVPRARNP